MNWITSENLYKQRSTTNIWWWITQRESNQFLSSGAETTHPGEVRIRGPHHQDTGIWEKRPGRIGLSLSFIVNKFVDYAIQQNSNVKDVIYSSSGFFDLHSASNCACGLATNVHTCKGIAKNEYILNTSQLATATDTKHACGSSALHRQLSKSRKNHHLCLFHENG